MTAQLPTMTGRPAADAGATAASVFIALPPIMATVLATFLTIGLALPALPLHVRNDLAFGPFGVGLVAGSQFGASLVSRVWAARAGHRQGPKRAVVVGLVSAAIAGLLCPASLPFVSQPMLSVVVLLAGRAVLGWAESVIITGATAWGLACAGAANAGQVIAWRGTAMVLGFAAGAPLAACAARLPNDRCAALIAKVV